MDNVEAPAPVGRGLDATIAPSSLVAVRNLWTNFLTEQGIVHAVNGVSFTVDEGELVGIIGETGCGKSVTVRSMLRLIRPPGRIVDGEVLFRGVDLLRISNKELRELRGSSVSFIPQNPWGSLNPILRIECQFRNIIKAHFPTTTNDQCTDMALATLRHAGLQGPERVLKAYAHELSGGMAQRVVISIALVLSPKVVIADEPTTGLDVTIQRQILDRVVGLLKQDRRAMLLVTHDLGIVAQYCNRVIVMYAGKVVETGLVEEVLTQPGHPYTQALVNATPHRGRKLVSLRGTVPSLLDYPKGCPFYARCDYEHELAADVPPELHEISPGRAISCHLPKGVTDAVPRSS